MKTKQDDFITNLRAEYIASQSDSTSVEFKRTSIEKWKLVEEALALLYQAYVDAEDYQVQVDDLMVAYVNGHGYELAR